MYTFIVVLFCFTYSHASNDVAPKVVRSGPDPEAAFASAAAIYSDFGEDLVWFRCTGSIIHERWILTAGRCLDNPPDYKLSVRVGEALVSKETPKLEVETYFFHPEFRYNSSFITWNDVGLVKLQEPLVWSASVQPITLGSIDEENEVGLQSTGYVQQEADDPLDMRLLSSVMLKTVKFEQCRAVYENLGHLVDGSTQICGINAANKTLCNGNPGWLLVGAETGKQVGVFSSWEDCTGRRPMLFTRISHFLPWLRIATEVATLGTD